MKKIIYAFVFLAAHQIYTDESEKLELSQSHAIKLVEQPSVSDNQEISVTPEQWQQIDDMHEMVTNQTNKIQFTLQSIEGIIYSNKIKINKQKTDKSSLLEHIKRIKEVIEAFIAMSAIQQQKTPGMMIEKIIYFNNACIHYLLDTLNQDFNDLNVEKFDKIVMNKFIELMQEQINPMELLEKNNRLLEKLIHTADNVGLSAFNKLYRFLDRHPLPITGKSTFSTMYDLATISLIGLATYGIGMYMIPDDVQVPFFNKTAKDLFWKKNFIGTVYSPKAILSAPLNAEDRKNMMSNLTPAELLDLGLQVTSSPLIALTTPLIFSAMQPAVAELTKFLLTNIQNLKQYYGNGDASQSFNPHDYVKAYFKDIVGGKALEQEAKLIADYIKNPTRYERQGNSPATGYLLIGPSQTGKSFFARALRTLIDEQFEGSSKKVAFFDVTAYDVEKAGFAYIFAMAREFAPVIIFIDELDMLRVNRDKSSTNTEKNNTQELLIAMTSILNDKNKNIIVIAATNRPEDLDFALKQKGRFGNIITFDYPSYQLRKEYLEKQLNKRNINLSTTMIDMIAQETEGQTYNMIDDIIRQALQISTYKLRTVIEADFEMVLDREIRKIKPNLSMSEIEAKLVAIYQAGQAVARNLLNTDRKIIKITIDSVGKIIPTKEGQEIKQIQKGLIYENSDLVQPERKHLSRLGFVFTTSTTNHTELLSDSEQDKELMALLAGQASLEIIKNSQFTEFGKEDRAQVLQSLEKRISQGTPVTEKIHQQAITEKENLYQKVKILLQPHTKTIQAVADRLVADRTITKATFDEIITQDRHVVQPTKNTKKYTTQRPAR